MTTFIISAFLVGFLSSALNVWRKAYKKAKLQRYTNETFLPNLLEVESFGFQVIPRDKAIKATLERGRANRAAILKGVDAVTISDTVGKCYYDRDAYKSLSHGIAEIKSRCNVDILPDLTEEVKKYADTVKRHSERVTAVAILEDDDSKKNAVNEKYSALMTDTPYYIKDQLQALEDMTEGIYIRIKMLQDERETTFNNIRKLEIDEKVAQLQLRAAKKQQEIDKLKSKYLC